MITAVLFFTSLFLFTSYSASISALIQSNSNSIKSIRDIVESSMTFSAQLSPYGKYYFEVSTGVLVICTQTQAIIIKIFALTFCNARNLFCIFS